MLHRISDRAMGIFIAGGITGIFLAVAVYAHFDPAEGPPPPYPFWHVEVPEPSNPSP